MPIKIGNIEVYDIQELCKTFQVDEPTLMGCIENGSLKGQKLGNKWYVSSRVLEEFFERDYHKANEDETVNTTTSIEELELSIRASNILASVHVETVEDLSKWSEKELFAFRGFGKSSLREIKRKLADFGLTLRENEY